MESTPFFTIILIISYSEELPAAKQTEIENNIVGCTAIYICIFALDRENVLCLTRAKEKIELIFICKYIFPL